MFTTTLTILEDGLEILAVTVPPVVTAVIDGVLYPVSATPPIVTLPSKLLSPPVNKLVWLSILTIPFCGINASFDSTQSETSLKLSGV